MERDERVVRLLAERPRTKDEVTAVLGTTWKVAYNSLTRLRRQGLVALHPTGTPTPVWRLTDAGYESVSGQEIPSSSPTPEVGEAVQLLRQAIKLLNRAP